MSKKLKTNNNPKVHEIDVFLDGGEVEILKLGKQSFQIRPLDLERVQELLGIYRHSLPIAKQELDKIIPPEQQGNLNQALIGMGMLAAMLTVDVTNKIFDFVATTLDRDRKWLVKTVKPKGVIQILWIMIKQSELEEYFPFLQNLKSARKK